MKGNDVFENYRQYYQKNWKKHWNQYVTFEDPFVENVIWRKDVQKDYGLYTGYFCVMSMDLFDQDIDFDKIFKVNNMWLAIKLMDEMVDNGHSEYPNDFLDAAYESLWYDPIFDSEREFEVSSIFRDSMQELDYMNNPNLCEASYNLKEAVKKGLLSKKMDEFLRASAEAGNYSGELTGYGLVPGIEHDSGLMEYMRRISTAVNVLDDIKNYKEDKENFDLEGNGAKYLLSAGGVFAKNMAASFMSLPKGKKMRFLTSTIPHSINVFK